MKDIIYWARHVEPVAVTTLVAAIFTLVVAVREGHLDVGIVNAVVIAALGLLARSQVSPTGPKDDATDTPVEE